MRNTESGTSRDWLIREFRHSTTAMSEMCTRLKKESSDSREASFCYKSFWHGCQDGESVCVPGNA